MVFKVRLYPLKHSSTQFLVCQLPAPESQGDLDLVTVTQEAKQVPQLYLVIPVLGSRSELHFLDMDLLLFFLRRVFLFILLKQELAIIHHPAYGWFTVWDYFYQVQFGFLCQSQCFIYADYSDLLPVGAD